MRVLGSEKENGKQWRDATYSGYYFTDYSEW
jgi:hypothetical protein